MAVAACAHLPQGLKTSHTAEMIIIGRCYESIYRTHYIEICQHLPELKYCGGFIYTEHCLKNMYSNVQKIVKVLELQGFIIGID